MKPAVWRLISERRRWQKQTHALEEKLVIAQMMLPMIYQRITLDIEGYIRF